MAEDKNKHKKKKYNEPKISEIEKLISSFRDAHGHDKLMSSLKATIKNIGTHQKKSQKNNSEPNISELEKLLSHFREEHGHTKLTHSISEATKDTKRKTSLKHPEHTIYRDEQGKPQHIKKVTSKDIAKDLRNGVTKSFRFIKEKMKHRKYRYPAFVVGIFVGLYILFNLPIIYTRINWKESEDTKKFIVRTEETVQKEMADSATLAPGEVIPAESRIIIPKIGVNVPIIYADTWDEKAIQDMLHSGVVHYKGTANPGEVGNSFITGHSSNYWWDTGKYNQAFLLIDKLEVGDKAIVYYNNKKFVYTVRDKKVVESTDMSVLAPTETPVLSLMTCTPPGTSWKRLVVKMDRTDPVFYKPETVTKEKVVEIPKPEKKKKGFLERFFSIFSPG